MSELEKASETMKTLLENIKSIERAVDQFNQQMAKEIGVLRGRTSELQKTIASIQQRIK